MQRTTYLGVLALVTLAGCATSMSVSSHVDRAIDFGRYRTYDWGPAGALPTGDPRLDKDPFFKDVLQGAVERSLAGRGLQLAEAGAPDLLLHYHANVSRRVDPNRVDTQLGYCAGDDCISPAMEYEAGTIVLDIVDTSTNRVVWRGWAQDRLENMIEDRERMERTINDAVTRMMARLPIGEQR